MDVLPENSMELLELVIEVWRCLTLVYSIQFEAGLLPTLKILLHSMINLLQSVPSMPHR